MKKGIKYISNTEGSKPMPCMTFCSMPGFKNSDFHLTRASFIKDSFNLQDVFHSDTLKMLDSKAEHLVSKTESILMGTCHTICRLTKVKPFETILLNLNQDWDLQLFLHPQKSELWFLSMGFVLETPFISLNTTNDEDIQSAELFVHEVHSDILAKDNFPCKHYTIDVEKHNANVEFVECCRNNMWKQLKPLISCTIAGMSALIGGPIYWKLKNAQRAQ